MEAELQLASAQCLVPGPEWNGEKFNLGKAKAGRREASPLRPLHPHLQGRCGGAKPKPDGLIGPKDNK